MKILELRFKNLNSIYGEWVIDFTDPEYVSSGIFALIGPTGAGKSTILDAICLALYGATPRLGKITKSGNEIMSRQTGECYAEVLFQSQAGRFRCHWEQRRARKKADANLQDQEHQIIDADTGKPIETKKSLVTGIIEEKTGMDFDRFTRSILLAQGGFDTFLKANVEEKSRILEQITGTGIYSRISCCVHERQRAELEKLNLLKAESSGIVLLEPEQEAQIKLELEAKQKQEVALTDKSTKTAKAIAWLSDIDKLKNELSSLAEETLKQQRNIEDFEPEREKLNWAIKAASLDGTYATLATLRKQQATDQIALKTEEDTLPKLELATAEVAKLLQSAGQQTEKAKAELKTATPLIQKIRSLDQKLTEQEKVVLESEQSCKKDAKKIDADKQTRLKEQKKRNAIEKKLQTAGRYLSEHAQDEWLISGLGGVEEQFANLLIQQKDIVQKENELKKADKTLKQATKQLETSTKQCAICKQELDATLKKLQQEKNSLNRLLDGKLLREYRAEKENMLREMAYLKKIEELENYRLKLEDGKPCPLCGAAEHPFAEGNVPVPDETEKKIITLTKLITKAEKLEIANKKLEAAEVAARKNLTESEKLEATSANDKKNTEKTVCELNSGLEKLQTSFAELKQTVSSKLQPLGISKIPDDDISSLLKLLQNRLNIWQEQVSKKAEFEKQLAIIDSELKRLDAIIETQNATLSEKQQVLKILKKEYASGSEERKKLYGDKKPDAEEHRLNDAVTSAEANAKKAEIRNAALQQKLITAKTHVKSLKERIEQQEPELKKAEAEFSSIAESVGLLTEKQFCQARLPEAQRNTLASKAKQLDDAQTGLKAKQKDREIRLNNTLKAKVTEKTLDELNPQFKEHESSLKELRDAIARLKHKWSENTTAKERIKEKQATIEAQKKECARWSKLHHLIGSADGKKYRNFAQGLTFELMVAYANQQLKKMSGRYLLIRDARQPLELNVVDGYQAGEIRSTRNLSGGESFIVSLTLALGLSQMASRKVRVDSLFLDEGFGTLDEDSLEIALETLSEIQQEGKLIGIISHVPALKEIIRTQIVVTPTSGGHSTLTGPGCSEV